MTRSAAALICLLFSISQLQAQVSQANDSIEQSRDSILFANALQGIVPASIFGDLNTVRTIKKPFPRHPKLFLLDKNQQIWTGFERSCVCQLEFWGIKLYFGVVQLGYKANL